jgi:outer membrane protein OmpU
MKKLLVASTALVAVAAVSSAQAADPIKISVGGFMEQWVGYANSDDLNGTTTKYATVRQSDDNEIYFRGSTTLDSGIKVSVVVDMEADAQATGYDDTYLALSSDTMGTLKLGSTLGFGAGNHTTAPEVGIGLGDADNWITEGVTMIGRDPSGEDGQKITYASPSFAGLTVGASYGTSDAEGDDGAVDLKANTRVEIETSFGASYSGDFDGVGISASVGYVKGEDKENTATTYEASKETHAGLSVSVAGFTVGGGYTSLKNQSAVKDSDASVWDLGVSYEFDEYAVSASYVSSEADEAANDSTPDKYDVFMVSGAYDLGAGVVAKASIFSTDDDDGGNVATTENDGWGVVAGLKVSF